MRLPVRWPALALVIVLVLSGCLAGEPDVEPQDPASGNGNGDGPGGLGTIAGTVVDADFTPVVGAAVLAVRDGKVVASATSDERGAYELTGLEPVEHLLRVSAPCCREHVQRYVVQPGGTHKVDVRLELLPSLVPYVLEDVFSGQIGCSNWVFGYGYLPQAACSNTDPNHNPALEFFIHEGIKTVVFAMTWERVPTNNPAGDLRLTFSQGQTTQPTLFDIRGPSPLEGRAGPHNEAWAQELWFDNIEDRMQVRFLARAANEPPASLVYQQSFTIHYHRYFVEEAPPGASALP